MGRSKEVYSVIAVRNYKMHRVDMVECNQGWCATVNLEVVPDTVAVGFREIEIVSNKMASLIPLLP